MYFRVILVIFRILEFHAYWKIWVIIKEYSAHGDDGITHDSYIILLLRCCLTDFIQRDSLLIDCHSLPLLFTERLSISNWIFHWTWILNATPLPLSYNSYSKVYKSQFGKYDRHLNLLWSFFANYLQNLPWTHFINMLMPYNFSPIQFMKWLTL